MKKEETLDEIIEDSEMMDEVEEIDEKDQTLAKSEEIDYEDRYLRLNAEFQNYKRRVEKERIDSIKFANERLFMDLLPIMDNMERALDSTAETDKNGFESIKKGVEMIKNSLDQIFESYEIKRIKALGEEFNHDVHHAVATEEVEGVDQGIVTKEMQVGYKIKDKVLRPSMVMVSE